MLVPEPPQVVGLPLIERAGLWLEQLQEGVMLDFDQVKVFSATKARDRDALGDRVTDFIQKFDGDVVGKVVRQSSDREFHCLSIVLFLRRSRMGRVTPQTRMLRG